MSLARLSPLVLLLSCVPKAATLPPAPRPPVVTLEAASRVSVRIEPTAKLMGPDVREVEEEARWSEAVPSAVEAALQAKGFRVVGPGGSADLVGEIVVGNIRTAGLGSNSIGEFKLILRSGSGGAAVIEYMGVNESMSSMPGIVGQQIANEAMRSTSLEQLVASLQAPAPARIEPKKPETIAVAVFDVEAPKLDDSSRDQLTDYLAAKLAQLGEFRIVPRDQIRSRLAEEKSESFKACFDQSCQIELGKAVAAAKSLSTKVLKVGSSCAMTSTLYDLRTEMVERGATIHTQCSDDALLIGVDQLVAQLKSPK